MSDLAVAKGRSLWLLIGLLVCVSFFSLGAAFFSQAASPSYPGLLRMVMLMFVLPQVILLAAMTRLGRGRWLSTAWAVSLLSWIFVGELALRVLL